MLFTMCSKWCFLFSSFSHFLNADIWAAILLFVTVIYVGWPNIFVTDLHQKHLMLDVRNRNEIIENDLLNCTQTNSGVKEPKNCALDTPTNVWWITNVQKIVFAMAPLQTVRAKDWIIYLKMFPLLPLNCSYTNIFSFDHY